MGHTGERCSLSLIVSNGTRPKLSSLTLEQLERFILSYSFGQYLGWAAERSPINGLSRRYSAMPRRALRERVKVRVCNRRKVL
jgi:hypothetical protein